MKLKRKIAAVLAALMVLTLGNTITTFADTTDGVVEEDVDTGIRYIASSTDSTQPYCIISGDATKDTDASAKKALDYKPKAAKNQATSLDYRLKGSTEVHVSQSNMNTIAERYGTIDVDFDGGYAYLYDVNGSKAFDFSVSLKENAKVSEKLKTIGFDGKASQFKVGSGNGNFPGYLSVWYTAVEGDDYQNSCEYYTYYYNPLSGNFELVNKQNSYADRVGLDLYGVKAAGTYVVANKEIKNSIVKNDKNDIDIAGETDITEDSELTDTIKEKIDSMQKGETLEIANFGNLNLKIEKDAFRAVQNKNVSLSVYAPTNNAVFKFSNFDTIDKMSGSFDPNVKIGKNIVKDIDKVMTSDDRTKAISYVTVSFDYDGILPGKTEVTLDVSEGGFTDGATVYLYYFNDKTAKFELVGESTYSEGFAAFELEHCSDYIVTAQKLDESVTEPTGTANITAPKATPKDTPKAAKKASVPHTGDTAPIIPFAVLLVAGFVAITVVFTRKKRA